MTTSTKAGIEQAGLAPRRRLANCPRAVHRPGYSQRRARPLWPSHPDPTSTYNHSNTSNRRIPLLSTRTIDCDRGS